MSGNLRRPALFALLTAMSGSLPIMLSPKQTGYYAAPSWPFYCLALALWSAPEIGAMVTRAVEWRWPERFGGRLRGLAMGAVAATVLFSPLWAGRNCRDQRLIHDVREIGRVAGPHARLNIPLAMRTAWSPQAYLCRMFYIEATVDGRPGAEDAPYYLELVDKPRELPADCTPTDAELALYRLYRRGEAARLLPGDASRR